ncbi:polysaccharide biosynthesis tyrosine autokinase [uncultured Tateyamaria sp.]|uniref:GumC family protein n=1 Tax=Tateyamaria sp. 1078 TaxID=3417464 RepID=UPI0026202F7A|nr:polysaccharide biosynthesis tyrosine autokinase [uncultured Tateyamaria sp.]
MNVDRISQMRPELSDRDAFLPSIDMGDVLRGTWLKLLRNWRILAACLLLSICGSIYYVLTATALYTANGALLIDPRVGQALESGSKVNPAIGSLDALTVDSELRVLTSREVTTRTMQTLRFGERTEEDEDDGGMSIRAWLTQLIGLDAAPAGTGDALPGGLQAERQREALRRSFVRGFKAERAGDSYVIDISYTSPDLVFAAEAVNTLMREYLTASGQQQVEVVERTRDWLSERIEALEISVREAETAVAEFRGDNELVALQGELLPTEIALNASIEELIRLRGALLVIEVQVEQLTEQIEARNIEAVQVPAEERSNALDEFQKRYAELLREEQELLVSWAEDAPVMQANRQQQDQIRALILDEYRQVRDRLSTRADALARQVAATDIVISDLRGQYSDNIRQTVELRNLEREADAKRQLYERLLEEFNSSSQLLTFDATSARVIAWAVPPDRKSAPQSRQIVVLAVFGAMVLAVSLILLREALDGSFRAYDEIGRDLGLQYLGLVPSFRSEQQNESLWKRLTGGKQILPGPRWKKLSRAGQRLGFASNRPTSVSAETMRAIHVQLMLQRDTSEEEAQCQIVGFTSTTRGEGKTTASFNFASFLAQQSERVAIIDLDLASKQMSKLLEPVLPGTNELSDFLDNPKDALSMVMPVAEFPNLAVVGNSGAGETPVTMLRDQKRIENMLSFFREYFDYIILDLPPAQGVADTRLLTKLSDHLVYMVRWGSTPRSQVMSVFRQRLVSKDRILGVLFSRANIRKYRWFNRDDMIDYYS